MNLKTVYVYRIIDPQKYGVWSGNCLVYDRYHGKAVFNEKLPEDKLEEWGLAYEEVNHDSVSM